MHRARQVARLNCAMDLTRIQRKIDPMNLMNENTDRGAI